MELARLDLGGLLLACVVEVEELAGDDSDTDSLLMVQAEYVANLVFDVSKIAGLLAAKTDYALVPARRPVVL